MSNQDEPAKPEPGHGPDDYMRTNPDGSQTPQYPGQGSEPPSNPYGSAETSSYGAPPTHSPYGAPGEPPTQPYAAQPPYGQAPYGQAPYGQPGQPYGYGQGYATPPPHPSSTTAMVLGLVSLIGLFICVVPIVMAPFAWVTGGRVVKAIDAEPGRWSGREQAQAGRIMGMIGTAILVLIVLAVVAFIVLFAAVGVSTYETTSGYESDL
ncbi:DUF4190 domain-containing protein [Nocardioides sediminis]|uniref:DUF4190 domain-containing protein n=1 Tax=Nocardioides sediminis TaxID=433648 RepID=UPI0018FFD823|nr:DUF4190 domain-containing protein [Nocardioides sediminis]